MEVNRIKFLPKAILGKKWIISLVSLILFVSVITYAVYETTKATVTVMIDGEETVIETHAATVEELMLEQEWQVKEHDLVEPSLDTEVTGEMDVTWTQAKQVVATIDGEEESIWTTVKTVEELINQLDIQYKEHDLIEPGLDTEITENMDIVYESAFLVELTSDGEQLELWTTSTTVADFLEKENVSLGELDRVEPALNERLDEETDIQVIRVEKVTDVVEENVDFATVTRKDGDLLTGKEKVVQSGKAGQINKHYEVILENGVEISRELVKTETVKESQDRIVAVGTQPVPATSRSQSPTNSSNASDRKGRTITVTSTAYTANCSGCSGITATGINLNTNRNMKVIAVDPRVIPLGSRVFVEGYGTAIAGDTGGAISGNKIDVHMPTKADAYKWGTRTVKITILE